MIKIEIIGLPSGEIMTITENQSFKRRRISFKSEKI